MADSIQAKFAAQVVARGVVAGTPTHTCASNATAAPRVRTLDSPADEYDRSVVPVASVIWVRNSDASYAYVASPSDTNWSSELNDADVVPAAVTTDATLDAVSGPYDTFTRQPMLEGLLSAGTHYPNRSRT